VGLEALIRWNHPTRGQVPPTEFLPVAETTGLIRLIGNWTIEQACRDLHRWRRTFPRASELTVSVNLSNRQFWDPDLRSYVNRTLAEWNLPATALVFEVTEGVIMSNQEAASAIMSELRKDSIKLHVDDFGTGYSSLATLHAFPVDALKIDRSFVSRMNADARSRELVRTMINMGWNLGIDVIAEGIETEEEAALLASMRCPLVQGYLFSRPMPARDVPRLIAATFGAGQLAA
jgi:EAL domain-containing protein (putative c-di-GMP-specific phosphodiesterase class I)